jgi:hypothetical protein
MGDRIDDVGGLFQQFKTMRWFPEDSDVKFGKRVFDIISQLFSPGS